MALSMSALATNDAVMRWVGDIVHVGQMIVVRGLFLMAALYVSARYVLHQEISIHQMCHKWCLMRGLAELGATYLFLTSLFMIPIATATTLVFLSPILLTAMSRFVFGEQVGPWRWAAVFVGFIGVLLVTTPSSDDWNPVFLLPLGAALLVALRDASTRMVAPHISSGSVTMTTAVVVFLGGLASYPFGWNDISVLSTGWLALAALIIAVSFFSIVTAFRIGEMSLIAPIQYIVILWATAYGWLIWDEVPEPRAALGGGLIIGSGLLILYRERVARNRALKATT